jgi:hypothetical protein
VVFDGGNERQQRGGGKVRATRKDCGRNNKLEVTGAAMDDSDDQWGGDGSISINI